MNLVWKFNAALLAIFILGFALASVRLVPGTAGQCARGSAAARPDHDGSCVVGARLHQYAGQAAAWRRSSSTGFCRNRFPRSPPPSSSPICARSIPTTAYKEATLNPTNPRNRAADWEADVVNVFRADTLPGSRPSASGIRRKAVRCIWHGRSRSRMRRALSVTAPRMRHAKTMIETYGAVQRLRLESERYHRRAGRIGADRRPASACQLRVQDFPGVAGGRFSSSPLSCSTSCCIGSLPGASSAWRSLPTK